MAERVEPARARRLGDAVAAVLRRLAGLVLPPRRPARPACRLTEAEALLIAQAALETSAPLVVRKVSRTADGVRWRIAAAVIGSGRAAVVDDETGDVVELTGWPGR